jgi:hypothetical protein
MFRTYLDELMPDQLIFVNDDIDVMRAHPETRHATHELLYDKNLNHWAYPKTPGDKTIHRHATKGSLYDEKLNH